jgi:hypothetical protein
MSENPEVKRQARELLREIRNLKRVATAYDCSCGQRIILTNFEPSALQRGTREVGIVVMERDERAVCPRCRASLASAWQSSERTAIEAMMLKLNYEGIDGLVQILQAELRGLRELRLRCN